MKLAAKVHDLRAMGDWVTGDYVKKVKIVWTGNRKQIDGQRCDLRKLCIMIVSDKHDSESMRHYETIYNVSYATHMRKYTHTPTASNAELVH